MKIVQLSLKKLKLLYKDIKIALKIFNGVLAKKMCLQLVQWISISNYGI